MFIRWHLYRSQALDPDRRKYNDKRARLKAILVESVRVDGKPSQNHIAFLGSISINGDGRERFWYDITKRLNRLNNRISPADRERIIASVTKKAGPPLTDAELINFERARARRGKRN